MSAIVTAQDVIKQQLPARRRLPAFRHLATLLGALIVGTALLVAIFAPYLTPHDPFAQKNKREPHRHAIDREEDHAVDERAPHAIETTGAAGRHSSVWSGVGRIGFSGVTMGRHCH